MSRPISELASNRAGVRNGERYGIEVEAEGCSPDVASGLQWSNAYYDYWGTVGDGSLRNGGIEFVSKPLTRAQVPTAINALWPYILSGRARPSVRTGIHIHASCLGRTIAEVQRILMHYALVEPVLFDFVGPAREENIYCIPWYRSPEEATNVTEWLSSYDGIPFNIRGDGPCKYSALFVGPLTTFGTIEFRHAPTFTDPEMMRRWFAMVKAVWGTWETTYDPLDEWRKRGPVAFAKSVLGFEWLPEYHESLFEEADVEAVAALLRPPKSVLSPVWGKAPELTGKGVATPAWRGVPGLTLDEMPTLDDMLDRDRGRARLMARLAATGQPLTVNVEEATPEQRMWYDLPPTAPLVRMVAPEDDTFEFLNEPDEEDDDFSTDDDEDEVS